MAEQDRTLISVEGLNWYYGNNHVLKDISLNFRKGKLISILGPNGSGKTTLLRNLTAGLKPEQKRVFLRGKDILSYSNRELARNLAFVPQNTYVDFEFSTLDIVLMGRQPYLGRFENEGLADIEIAKEAMKQTDTWKFRDRLVTQLSGGEIQRVVIARALAQQADILVMDEPVAHLDIYNQLELFNLIKELQYEKMLTIIVALHDLNLASQYSDEIVLLKDGHIIAKGNPREVVTKKHIQYVYGVDVDIIDNPKTCLPYILIDGIKNSPST